MQVLYMCSGRVRLTAQAMAAIEKMVSETLLVGPVAVTMSSQCRGPGVPSLARELDPTCLH